MGQSASSESKETAPLGQDYVLEQFTRQQITDLFQWRAMQLFSKEELAILASKLNVTVANDPAAIITYSDLAYLLQLLNKKTSDILSIHDQFVYVIKLLYDSFRVLGNLPLLQNALEVTSESQLTSKGLLLATLVHLGRIGKVWPTYDHLKLIFISLALAEKARNVAFKETSKISDNEKAHYEEPHVVEILKLPPHHKEDLAMDTTSKRVKWNTFKPLINYDKLDVDSMELAAYDLVQVITLLLIVNSIPRQSHAKMQQQIQNSISKDWADFEAAAIAMVRYINVDINATNLKGSYIMFLQFQNGNKIGISDLITLGFSKIFKYGVLLLIVIDPSSEGQVDPPEGAQDTLVKKPSVKFEPTRLMHGASISLLSTFLLKISAGVDISAQNLVELYNGSHSGFSVRSLELKIFKWHAPTLFLVSGKRLRSKTISTNKRYQQFNTEFPRFFLSAEDPARSWQTDHDRITYAVFVNQPWKNSNKKNFGDEKTTIMALLPRCDIFRSKHDPVLGGQLIYFNNMGMGIGFGNDQPVNKNNVRKYLPGSVSLTIEANLEFGVFRHIVNAGANTSHYFTPSEEDGVQGEDYEDRFMITDLEVWGVGSTKELEEQRKQWEWEEKQAQARQSVNIRALGEDRAFLEMAGLVGNHGAGGSV